MSEVGSPLVLTPTDGLRRSDGAVIAPWGALALLEVWFSLQGFVSHSALQHVLEVVCLLVIGACIARFAGEGWRRSPLWPGVVAVAWTSFLLGPAGIHAWLGLIGLAVVSAALVWLGERVRPGVWVGLFVALGGGLVARAMVLDRADGDGQGIVRAAVWRTVGGELTSPFRPLPAPTADGPPLVLITVDTLRADAAVEMASFQRIAAVGALWPRAMATSSWTLPSVATLQTGQLPADHGAGVTAENTLQGVSAEVATLAESLASAGYQTAAFVTNPWLEPTFGLHRGFHRYDHTSLRFPHLLLIQNFPGGPETHEAEAIVDRALAWLDDAPERGVFLWVHLVDPHLPYLHAADPVEASLTDEKLRSGMRLTPAIEAQVRSAYAAEVAYTDAHLGRLLDGLEGKGMFASGVVAMTADHGEELWDHGGTGHGHQHHTEVIDVALALSAPDLVRGERADLASLVDVAPTLAAAAGLELGTGRDLREPVPADRIAVAQGTAFYWQAQSSRGSHRRAIVRAQAPERVTCYDLAADPGEHFGLPCPPQAPEVEAAVSARPPQATGATVDIPTDALKALGYFEDDP